MREEALKSMTDEFKECIKLMNVVSNGLFHASSTVDENGHAIESGR